MIKAVYFQEKEFNRCVQNNDMGDFNNDFNSDFSIMNKQELLTLIETKIAGQGNQVDLGGVLAGILKAAIDGAVAVEVTDITAIDGAILDSLNVGDKIAKVTGKQKHLYQVSYKGAGVGEGICLTYTDASVIETVSYDYTDEGWAYNSTDKWEKG